MRLNKLLPDVFVVLGLINVVSGCGGESGGGVGATNTTLFHNTELAVVSETDLALASESIEGTGAVALVSPLSEESQGGAHVGLTFQLLEAESEVALIAFATSRLESGITIQWTRTQTTVSADGQTMDITSKFSGIDWSEPVSFRVDIHNDEDPTHIIIWNQPLSGNVDEATEIYNSAETEDGNFQVPGRGHGVIGGLVLKQARVTDVLILAPQEEDHE